MYSCQAEAALDAKRRAAAMLGLVIRPRKIQKLLYANVETPTSKPVTDASPDLPSPGSTKSTSDTKVMYLATQHGRAGVLQLHQATWNISTTFASACKQAVVLQPQLQVQPADQIEGFTVLVRIEELWPLLARAQAFPNWFTKLHLGFIWESDTGLHVLYVECV